MSHKALTQAAHREQIARLPLIDELSRVLTILAIGWQPVYASPARNATANEVVHNKPPIIDWVPVGKEDIARYALLLRATEGLLRKLVPDMKSIEVNDNTEAKRSLSDVELAQRISGVLGEVRGIKERAGAHGPADPKRLN